MSTAGTTKDATATEDRPHTELATAEDNGSEATANSPLFHLARELRDNIYDRIMLKERAIHYEMALEAGKKPQISAFTTGGAGRACQQFRAEYMAAVERYVERLISHKNDDGCRLTGPKGETYVCPSSGNGDPVKLEISWTKSSGLESGQIIRTITISLPIRFPAAPGEYEYVTHEGPTFFLTFKLMGSKEYGSSKRLGIPWKLKDWDKNYYTFPSALGPSLESVMATSKAVNWKGSLREWMLWQTHFVRLARVASAEEER